MANQTISFRLSDEYQAIFNKLHEQACEANGSPISKVTFLEKVLDFYSSPKVKEVEVLRDTPETTAELEQLKKDYNEVSETCKNLKEEVVRLQSKLSENNEKTTSLQADYDSKQTDYLQQITELEEKVNKLTADLSTAENRSVLDLLNPFTAELLKITSEKLSNKKNENITPIRIVEDMFLRYTIEKNNQWFYKWVVTDAEILKIANNLNPAIKSIDQLKKILWKS